MSRKGSPGPAPTLPTSLPCPAPAPSAAPAVPQRVYQRLEEVAFQWQAGFFQAGGYSKGKSSDVATQEGAAESRLSQAAAGKRGAGSA